MPEQSFNLNFKGYWHEASIDSIPCLAGIYCIYVCRHDNVKNQVLLLRLLYIGEADDINQRIKNHEKWPEWKKMLSPGEELCFSIANLESAYRNRVEAALIFKHRPLLNDDYKISFPFDRTTVLITGASALLVPIFRVERT